MDHFNSTIRDGELVNTRRGLQVSRQKFNGISFVNAYPQNSGTASTSGSRTTTSPDQAKLSQREFKFVEAESNSRQSTPRSQRHDSHSPAFSGASSEPLHAKKARKRLTTRDQASTAPSAPSPVQSSRASSNTSSIGEGLNRSQTPRSQEFDLPDLLPRSQPVSSLVGPSLDSPTKMSEDHWRLFHRYFATLPSKIYPFEDILAYNPATGNEFYEMHANDEVAVQIVLMCGSIATAIIDEEINPKGLANYISIICAMLNRKLNQSKAVDDVTLLCIAALAASACYAGRLDHWHMHMRGLQKALDVNGGLSGLPAWLLNKIHLTDLEGATALACGPYLEYTRKFEPISSILAPALRNHVCSSFSTLLGPLQIDSTVVEALSSLSLFAASVKLARTSSGAVAFEPHAFTDEWLAVKHSLVTRPRPLQNQMAANPRSGLFSPFKVPGTDTPNTSNAMMAGKGELYMGSHRLQPTVSIIPAELGPGGPLEPALRIACLLYQKELLPNWPRNLGGYAVLLKLLAEHMQALYRTLVDGHGVSSLSADLHPSKAGTHRSRAGGNVRSGSAMRRISRGKGRSSAPNLPQPEPPLPIIAPSLKPVLLWLCVISDMISRIADQNECRRRPNGRDFNKDDDKNIETHSDNDDDDTCYPRAIYRAILRDILGIRTEKDVDNLLGHDQDLVMFGLLDPALIHRQSPLILKPEHAALVSRKGSLDKDGEPMGAEDCSLWLKTEPQDDNVRRSPYSPRPVPADSGSGVGWNLRDALVGIVLQGEGG
ncbi:hypothetical protein V8F20_005021 [Naviculisporaceae sp. PSN 640]